MEIKKYVTIERLKEKYMTVFSPGEQITITEKIDGANASVRVDATGKLLAFSRRQLLNPENTLQGFYDYAQTLDPKLYASILGERYILFGEWLVKHTIHYPENAYRKFYIFDLYDTETGMYCPHTDMINAAVRLNLPTVPVFYTGAFTNWEEITKFVGMTSMNAQPSGEGIVIKSQDRLDNQYSGTPAYVKIVASEFSEVHKSRVHVIDPEKAAAKQAELALIGTIVTERRVEKIIQKLIEDDQLPEQWNESHLPLLRKLLPPACFHDCRNEEPEFVAQNPNFGKLCAKLCMIHAKNLIP